MATTKIRGITIQLGGDASGLTEALSDVNRESDKTKRQLKDVQRMLKLDPGNTELLAQKQRLLSESVDVTKKKLEALKEAEKQVQKQVKDGKTQEQYDALKREIIATEDELKKLEEAAKSSNVFLEKVSATADKVAQGADKVAQGADKVANATRGVSTAATGALTAAAAGAISFEDSFAKVSTLLDDGRTDFDAYKQAIVAGSSETGIAVGEYAEAVYSAISASVDQADAVKFTTDAAKLAKGGFTDLTKSVDVLTTAINGYGMTADDADRIGDLLINTQNQGKTTVDELASSMGAVIPIAASANFTIEELCAGYALMTKNGIATAESGTYMKSMLSELTKHGSESDKALRNITGKGFAELRASGIETADILQILNNHAVKNNLTLKDMFGSVEAGSAALMLSKNYGGEFIEMLDSMNNSAGTTEAAYEKVTGTAGAKMKNSLNEAMNAGIQLGEVMLPLLDKVINFVGDLTGKLSQLDEGQLETIAIVLAVVAAISPVAGIVSGIASAVGGVSSALAFLVANPIVLVVAAVAAAVALIALYGDEIKAGLQAVDDFLQNVFAIDWTQVFGPVLGGALNLFFENVKTVWDGTKTVLDGIIDFVQGVFSGNWEQAWTGVQKIFGGAFGALVGLAKSPLNGLISMVNSAIDALNSVSFDMPDWLGGGHYGINIPNIPMLAKGGSVFEGDAIVGERGPEILRVANGKAVVEPLAGNSGRSESLLNTPGGGSGGTETIVMQVVLDGDVIGETSYKYAQWRDRMNGN